MEIVMTRLLLSMSMFFFALNSVSAAEVKVLSAG